MKINPVMLVTAFVMGSISAYFAHKRGKNPYFWFTIGFLFGIFGIFAMFFAGAPKRAAKKPVRKKPIFKIQGPTDKFWYYLDAGCEQKGPISRDALSLAWKEGKINLSTYVWHEEMTDWKPLKETVVKQ